MCAYSPVLFARLSEDPHIIGSRGGSIRCFCYMWEGEEASDVSNWLVHRIIDELPLIVC